MRAEEECHVWSILLLVDPIGKYPPLHLHDCVNVLEYSICIIHLLGDQASISKCEHITDENLDKEKIYKTILDPSLAMLVRWCLPSSASGGLRGGSREAVLRFAPKWLCRSSP